MKTLPNAPSILLFGSTSMAGYNLWRMHPQRIIPLNNPHNRTKPTRGWRRVDFTDRGALCALLDEHPSASILYCDAVCDVSKCEANPQWAWDMNVRNLENMLAVLPAQTRLLYLSSDHVFGGDGTYTESSAPCPISVYGRSRVAAEEIALARPGTLVVRAGLAVGPSIDGRSGHRDWLRHRHGKNLPITIVHDEHRSAVWAEDLASRLVEMLDGDVTGLRHIPAEHALPRPVLADYLSRTMQLPIEFELKSKEEQPAPHLGHVELESDHKDQWSAPLSSPVPHEELLAHTGQNGAEDQENSKLLTSDS